MCLISPSQQSSADTETFLNVPSVLINCQKQVLFFVSQLLLRSFSDPSQQQQLGVKLAFPPAAAYVLPKLLHLRALTSLLPHQKPVLLLQSKNQVKNQWAVSILLLFLRQHRNRTADRLKRDQIICDFVVSPFVLQEQIHKPTRMEQNKGGEWNRGQRAASCDCPVTQRSNFP